MVQQPPIGAPSHFDHKYVAYTCIGNCFCRCSEVRLDLANGGGRTRGSASVAAQKVAETWQRRRGAIVAARTVEGSTGQLVAIRKRNGRVKQDLLYSYNKIAHIPFCYDLLHQRSWPYTLISLHGF